MSFRDLPTSMLSKHTTLDHRRAVEKTSLRGSGIHYVMKTVCIQSKRLPFKILWPSFSKNNSRSVPFAKLNSRLTSVLPLPITTMATRGLWAITSRCKRMQTFSTVLPLSAQAWTSTTRRLICRGSWSMRTRLLVCTFAPPGSARKTPWAPSWTKASSMIKAIGGIGAGARVSPWCHKVVRQLVKEGGEFNSID